MQREAPDDDERFPRKIWNVNKFTSCQKVQTSIKWYEFDVCESSTFSQLFLQLKDVILSNEPFAEANNQLLPKADHSAFELEPNACVLSYILENKRYYHKIIDLTQRPSIPYPKSPPSH